MSSDGSASVLKSSDHAENPTNVLRGDDGAEAHTGGRHLLVFSDFDGTIFKQDTGHLIFDKYGCGPERRAELAKAIETGERTFRDASDEMWGSVHCTFEQAHDLMISGLEIDPDFKAFNEFCWRNSVPFAIISAGVRPLLRAILDHFLGPDVSRHIDLISNDVSVSADGRWTPIWRHPDSPLGHDKSRSIEDIRARHGHCTIPPLIVMIGDGVSDLAAAGEADVLFAKQGMRLEQYCVEKHIPHTSFTRFAEVQRGIVRVMSEDYDYRQKYGKPKYDGTVSKAVAEAATES